MVERRVLAGFASAYYYYAFGVVCVCECFEGVKYVWQPTVFGVTTSILRYVRV